MTFHKIMLISITAFILSYACFAQISNQKVIAKIGSYEITEDEFLERYELTPQVNVAIRGIDKSLKNEVLYSIIAEKLWALEAEVLRLTNSELIESTYKAIEKMYVRDALYREEILSKVKLSDEYLLEAFRRNSMLLKVSYLFSQDKDEILNLFQKIRDGAAFDSLLLQRPEYTLQSEPYIVNYGQMEQDVEDSLYKLKPGEISLPIEAPNGWYIFKLISFEEKIIRDAKQEEAEQKNVIKIARATITDSIYKEYYSRFFADVNVETNTELFLKLSNLVVNVLYERSKNKNISAGEQIFLLPEDLYNIESELGEENLHLEFIRLDNQPATLNDFLQALAFEKFSIDTLDVDLIKLKLNYFIKQFVEYELLAREGYKRGLQYLPDVQRYLKMWKSYYLSEAFRKNISEGIEVSDEEAYDYFQIKTNTSLPLVKVKIVEILSDDLDVFRDALNELEKGADFRELAIKYTKREEAKINNGELGFFSVDEYGDIGRRAAIMEIGDIYGPLKVSEGYSLFKLIDKKEEHGLSKLTFNDEKEKIKAELKHHKFSSEIINKTVELANKYGVSVNKENLESVSVLHTTTVVYRYFGFGGRLLAVPMTPPNYLWVKPWEEQEILSP